MIAIALAIWLTVSALVCWLWGRVVRLGMVELQPGQLLRGEVEP